MAAKKKSATKKKATKKKATRKKSCNLGKECLMPIPAAPQSTNPEALKKWKIRVRKIRKRNAQVTAVFNE